MCQILQKWYVIAFVLSLLVGWQLGHFREALAAPQKPPALVLGIGDSLTHGTMDGTNNAVNTLHAYLQLVAQSLALVMPIQFTQPLFDTNENRMSPFDIPTNLAVDGADVFSIEGLDYYRRAGANETVLSNSLLGDVLFPLGSDDNYDKVMYPINLLAGHPVSQIDAAVWHLNRLAAAKTRQKALLFLWIGNNESSTSALGYGGNNPEFFPLPLEQTASEINPLLHFLLSFGERQGLLSVAPYAFENVKRNLTALDDFADQFQHVLNRLLAAAPASEVDLNVFVMTLPYYSSVGYLIDSEDLEFYLQKIDPDYQTPPTFKRVAPAGEAIANPIQGDRVSLFTFGVMYALLDSGHSVSEVNSILEQNGQQQDGLVLSENERRFIMSRIDRYNHVIKTAARRHKKQVRVIDTGRFINDIFLGRDEVIIDGKVLSRKWVRGGGFSLDGVHPGYTGQALVANQILEQVNKRLRLKAPLYNLASTLRRDPYVDQDGDGWAPGPDYKASGLTKILFLFKDPDDRDATVEPVLPNNFWDQFSDAILQMILGIPEIQSEAARMGVLSR